MHVTIFALAVINTFSHCQNYWQIQSLMEAPSANQSLRICLCHVDIVSSHYISVCLRWVY